MKTYHKEFNLGKWSKKLAEVQLDDVFGFSSIVSPIHLLAHLKNVEIAASYSEEAGVETDVFVFGKGSPKLPFLTKLGGIPYRPANKPWPIGHHGEHVNFYGQICFMDSFDIVPKMKPLGDILLIFHEFYHTGPYFEWQKFELKEKLATKETSQGTIMPEYFGERYRTVDYAWAERKDVSGEIHSANAIAQGLKIGGVCPQNQQDHEGKITGGFTSFAPKSDIIYPFVNVKEPLTSQQIDDENFVYPNHFSSICFDYDEENNKMIEMDFMTDPSYSVKDILEL